MINVLNHFKLQGQWAKVLPWGNGHINASYQATLLSQEISTKYLLQKVNRTVFKDPVGVMKNLKKIHREFEKYATQNLYLPKIIASTDNQFYHLDRNSDLWRLFEFIDSDFNPDKSSNTARAFQAAKSYGQFLSIMNTDPATLDYTIPGFHDTVARYQTFLEVSHQDPEMRAARVADEIDYLVQLNKLLDPLGKIESSSDIPIRITHNDAKEDNLLIDGKSQVCCFVDLDTVMPGLIIYDFGDMVRSFCSSAEHEAQTDNVEFQLEVFEAVTTGFLGHMITTLTQGELDLLTYGCKIIVYEQCLRFLGDFLAGDIYYKVEYASHNLDRFNNQRLLLEALIGKEKQMESIVEETIRQLK